MKDFIESLLKLPITVKTVVVSVLVQLPLFFVAMYLLDKPFISRIDNVGFISDLDFWFMLACSFTLSLAYYCLSLALAAFIVINPRRKINPNNPHIHIMALLLSVLFLGLIICYGYENRLTFKQVVYYSFISLIIIDVFCLFRMIYLMRFRSVK